MSRIKKGEKDYLQDIQDLHLTITQHRAIVKHQVKDYERCIDHNDSDLYVVIEPGP